MGTSVKISNRDKLLGLAAAFFALLFIAACILGLLFISKSIAASVISTENQSASVIKLLPTEAPEGAAFGSAVAVQKDGFAVIGAPMEAQAGTTRQAGAAYVSLSGSSQLWRLTPSDAATRHLFGRAVALDGKVIVIGAAQAAYVFRFDGEKWVEEALLEQDCSQGRFGSAVAVSGDRILVGAPLRGCLQVEVVGNVFAYKHTGNGAWELERKLAPHSGTIGSYYGTSLSIESNVAVVGAPGWGEVFTYHHDGSTWQTGERIPDPIWGSSRSFGRSVAFRGGRLAVGTPGDNEVREGAGAAYVYNRTTTGTWVAEGKLVPPPTSPAQKLTGSYYGSTVGIFGDLLVMGGPQADIEGQAEGAVLVFRRESTSWKHQVTLTANDAGSADQLGTALDISNDVIIAGAPGHDMLGANVGAAYLFSFANEPPPPPPPPPNEIPKASFTYQCVGLTCNFDASGSADPDGTIVDYSWTFGDKNGAKGVKVSHTYASSGTYTVYLLVTDNGGKVNSVSQIVSASDGSGIVLSAIGGKGPGGWQKVSLTWSNAASANVDIYRNSVKIATVPNTGKYTDNIDMRGRGNYKYRVCEEATTICSNEVTATFD